MDQEIRLKDGRRLGFAQFGDASGPPLLYFHGWPSSRLEARLLEEEASAQHWRLIAPDRPGYGMSDARPGRTLSNWSADVTELADRLGLERFTVLGMSGGGPYACACAARIPQRLKATILVAALGPVDAPGATDGMVALNRWLLALAQKAPWLAERIGTVCLRALWRKGQQAIPRQIEERLGAPDKEALADPELRRKLVESSMEGLRNGVEGAAHDGFLYARPWDFALSAIQGPVHLWHGEKDVVVPAGMGRYLAKAIPNCRATFCPDDGHFSLPVRRMKEILGAVRGNGG